MIYVTRCSNIIWSIFFCIEAPNEHEFILIKEYNGQDIMTRNEPRGVQNARFTKVHGTIPQRYELGNK